MVQPVIIVGAGLAGWSTARELRKLDTTTPLMLITADTGDFYAKPSLSNAFAQGRRPAQLVTTPAVKMAEKLDVTLIQHTRVASIDPQMQTLTTGADVVGYSKLILAIGAQTVRAALEGEARHHVLSVNSLDDFGVFHNKLTQNERIGEAGRVLIMGAGLIGCEFANDLASAGYRVSVVDPLDGPLAALLPQQAGAQLRDALSELNVTWHFGAKVKAVDRFADGADMRLRISLSDGTQVHTDQILSAIGLKANISLAQAAGLACERGILVDSFLQTSAANVYALGDCAQYATGDWRNPGEQVSGGRTLPYVMPVMNAAKALAATLAGNPTRLAFSLMPISVKTPALPIVLAPPTFGSEGRWVDREPGAWLFISPEDKVSGFVLTGKQTARRAELSSLVGSAGNA